MSRHATHWMRPKRIEWPTLLVAFAVYSGFVLLTLNYHSLPWWLVFALGGFVVSWHGSLQHEAVHGHPTSWRWLNELLVAPSLWLWMPYRVYFKLHLKHHRTSNLTDPLEDPESYYVTHNRWVRMNPLLRALLRFNNSLAGRLLVGPFFAVLGFWSGEFRAWRRGEGLDGTAWLLHILGSTVVLVWVLGVCSIPLFEYLLLFVYPGVSLTLMRSFLEHQANPKSQDRTVIIEAEFPFALLYLNNNLHTVHHDRPGTAWYRLPAIYRNQRAEFLSSNGGYFYSGYREVARRFLLKSKEPVIHPSHS